MTRRLENVMVIDDEEVDQMLYRRILTRSGLVENIIPFLYADEALDYLRNGERPAIDVIFLDINIPRMNGFEFLDAAMNEIGPCFADAVVVMITTSLNPRDEERAAQYDVVKKFINKPLTIDHVNGVAELVA
ncbi:MAG: response regulator [Pseudomonadota bacterium]